MLLDQASQTVKKFLLNNTKANLVYLGIK